jgi:hypothetical protein
MRGKLQIFYLNYKMKTGVGASHIEESSSQSAWTKGVPTPSGSIKMRTSDTLVICNYAYIETFYLERRQQQRVS